MERWIIEVCHRQLKQEFGLSKSQNRDAWVVSGFIGLVCFAYSIWSFQQYKDKKNDRDILSCPSWANLFHESQIIHSKMHYLIKSNCFLNS